MVEYKGKAPFERRNCAMKEKKLKWIRETNIVYRYTEIRG